MREKSSFSFVSIFMFGVFNRVLHLCESGDIVFGKLCDGVIDE